MEYVLLFLLFIPPVWLTSVNCRNNGHENVSVELGVIFSWVVFLYSWLPFAGILLEENGVGSILDRRFVINPPTKNEYTTVALSYLLFQVAFVGWYYKIRQFSSFTIVKPSQCQVLLVLGFLILMLMLESGLWFLLGGKETATYVELYNKYRELPLFIAQIMGWLASMKYTLIIFSIVTIILFKSVWHKYIAAFLLILLVVSVSQGGSRSLFVLSCFAYVVAYILFVKRLKFHLLAFLSVGALTIFSLAGILRAGGFDADMLSLPLFQRGEFVSLFINPIDLIHIKTEMSDSLLDWRRYFVDIIGWIPQQFLWFEKLDLANWYVKTFYPKYFQMGGGLAFGTISESIAGYGLFEVVVRGSLLGIGYAYIANLCLSGKVGIIKALIYVWFVVLSYQAVRDTTFTLFPRFILHVLPLVVFFYVLKKYVNHRKKEILR